MAIEQPKAHGAPGEGQEYFEFARGTACNGVDYQPGDVGLIDRNWAVVFAQQSRGRVVTADELNAKAEAAKADAKKK